VNAAQPGGTALKGKAIMTSNKKIVRRTRTLAAVMFMTAGAGITNFVGATAPATAAPESFVAVAVGLLSDAPPVGATGGSAIDPDQNAANQKALSDCVGKGGHQCVVTASAQGGCAVAASNDFGEMVGASYITLRVAQEHAIQKLQNRQGAHVVASTCSNGQGQRPPAPAPAPPKLGPTASFNPTLGGLEAHITDRSGVAAQCTYVMENVNRSFGLSANATFDLRIVPLLPKFRDQSVTISCDNGTKTSTTAHF
jgi:Domain of unknown function (DUF4189)